MSNEANLVTEGISDTGLNGNFPNIYALLATLVQETIGETAINEELEVASLDKAVANIWINLESVTILKYTIIVKQLVVLSVCISNKYSNVNLVVNLVANLRSYYKLVALYRGSKSSGLSCVETNFTTYPPLSACGQRCNCNECSKNQFLHNTKI